MDVGSTAGEKSVRELAARLYRVNPSSAAARSVAAALLDANPHLASIAALPAGTPILVPEVSTATAVPNEVQPLAVAGVTAVVKELQSVIDDIGKALLASLESETFDAQHVLDAMKLDTMKDYVSDPLVKLEAKRASATIKGFDTAKAQLGDLGKTIQKDLKALTSGM